MSERFAPHRITPGLCEFFVAGTSTQGGSQVGLDVTEQAGANRAFAVSLVRSQSAQNVRVTEAMMPTRAGPPSTAHSSAGAEDRSGHEGQPEALP